jgi:hypothetical protein
MDTQAYYFYIKGKYEKSIKIIAYENFLPHIIRGGWNRASEKKKNSQGTTLVAQGKRVCIQVYVLR